VYVVGERVVMKGGVSERPMALSLFVLPWTKFGNTIWAFCANVEGVFKRVNCTIDEEVQLIPDTLHPAPMFKSVTLPLLTNWVAKEMG